jgi:hypothetical protein
MAQIKSYVDLENYDEITTFSGTDPERLVKSWIVTEENGKLAAQCVNDLVGKGGAAPSLQLISGKRGVGKSHLLAVLRSLLSVKALRPIPQYYQLQNALNQLGGKTYVTVDLSFVPGESPSFESALKHALDELMGSAAFSDQRWKQSIERQEVFAETLSAFPPGSQIVLLIDNLSARWRSTPDVEEDDLRWLKDIISQSASAPVRALIAVNEDDVQGTLAENGLTGTDGEFSTKVSVRELSIENLKAVVGQRIIKKKPEAKKALPEIYKQITSKLPNFAWSQETLSDYYPIHPVLDTLTPVIREHSRSFSLPGFTCAAVPRALNRPELSLVTLDDLFERYEYELRKSEPAAEVFAIYDKVMAATNSLPFEDKMIGKMLARAFALFLLMGQPVDACMLADSLLLFEGSKGETGYQCAGRLLSLFEAHLPESIIIAGEELHRTYQIELVNRPVSLKKQLVAAARDLPDNDVRLAELLIAIGGQIFDDWQPGIIPTPPDFPGSSTESSPFGDLLDEVSAALDPAVWEITWRGTVRRGRLCVWTPEGIAAARKAEAAANLDDETSQFTEMEDWRLVILPYDCLNEPDIPFDHGTLLRWRGAFVNDEAELLPLKMLRALELRLCEPTKDSEQEIADLIAELTEQVKALFTAIYLDHGTITDQNGAREIFSEWKEQDNFSSLLVHELSQSLDTFYPEHPVFEGNFVAEAVADTLFQHFSGSGATTEQVKDITARFAVPLGLVSESRGKHRLNVFNEAANLPPFIHALVTLVEIHADEEGRSDVPLHKVYKLLGVTPYGLQREVQHLILVAFISSGIYELVNESTGKRLTKSVLHLGFEPDRFTTLRRVATTDYPLDILHAWARKLTDNEELPQLVSIEARMEVREALERWLENWRTQDLRERLEAMPAEFMTMMTWQSVNMSMRRYERVAAVLETVLEDSITVETGLSRILDLFGLDVAALEITRNKINALAGYLDWLPNFIHLRGYLLAAESTGSEEIDELWEQMQVQMREPHELMSEESRNLLQEDFGWYCEQYTKFYLSAHDLGVGQKAYQNLLENFYQSVEWRHFKLLGQIKLDGRDFEEEARRLSELVERTRCELPTEAFLQRQPYCGCSFRLNRRLHLGSLLDAFTSLMSTTTQFYTSQLSQHSEELRVRISKHEGDKTVELINNFLDAVSEGKLDGLCSEIVGVLNRYLPEPQMRALLPATPKLAQGNFTREELRQQLDRWLSTLPEQEGLKFRVEGA